MKRRKFIATAGAGIAGASIVGCGNAAEPGSAPSIQTSPRVTWRLASSFSRSLDTIYGAADILAERLSALTDGKFTIRNYPGGELVPALEVLGSVQNGTVQMGHSASYYYTGKNPALAFDTCVPFGMNVRQYNAWVHHGGGMDILRSIFSDFNIINLPGGNTGVQMGGWFRREVASLSDLRGIKMRIPGLGGNVMDRLGVSVQVIASGDIYPALERGVIDATEWVGPYDDEKLGLNKVARFYYYPGWWEPGPGLTFYINRDEWEKLPSTYQEALTTAAGYASADMQSKYDAKNPPAFKRLIESGTQVRKFSTDLMEAASGHSMDIMQEYAANDAQYREVFDAHRQFQIDSNAWFGTAEKAYADFSFSSPA
jgi:TRAP-type mannitol/chloroaromatic compound transport system substrate-binding protein